MSGVSKERRELTEKAFALLPPIFRDCVSPRHHRMGLDAPWVDAGVVYASDGRILVCHQSPDPEVLEAVEKLVTMDGNYPGLPYRRFIGEWSAPVDIPSLGHLDGCKRCEATGLFGGIRCDDCGNLIRVPGVSMTCPDCDGSGIDNARDVPAAADVPISAYYAWILRSHQVKEISPPISGNPNIAWRFKMNGRTDGVLMPLVITKGGDDK